MQFILLRVNIFTSSLANLVDLGSSTVIIFCVNISWKTVYIIGNYGFSTNIDMNMRRK